MLEGLSAGKDEGERRSSRLCCLGIDNDILVVDHNASPVTHSCYITPRHMRWLCNVTRERDGNVYVGTDLVNFQRWGLMSLSDTGERE